MKALTFMIQREQGWSYEESQENMWVREADETGELMYVAHPEWKASLTRLKIHQSSHRALAAQSSSRVKGRSTSGSDGSWKITDYDLLDRSKPS